MSLFIVDEVSMVPLFAYNKLLVELTPCLEIKYSYEEMISHKYLQWFNMVTQLPS